MLYKETKLFFEITSWQANLADKFGGDRAGFHKKIPDTSVSELGKKFCQFGDGV